MDRIAPTRTTHHYCQFSGGGDIHIYKTDFSTPLVFASPTAGDTELTEPDEG